MHRLFLYACISLIVLASSGMARAFVVDGNGATDTVTVVIDTLWDQSGLLEGYMGKINSPVCEADKCYAIEIIFHWDLLGRFVSYDTIAGQGLTKLDHIPFTKADYQKLQDILKNDKSVLASYQKDQLVKNTRISDIDGFTGATIREIKDNVIEGAVYSCYTLWHLAHGSITHMLQQRTCTLFNEKLVKKMVAMQDQQVNYFLINNFSEKDFSDYLPLVLKAIAEGKGYFAKNAIEKIPDSVLMLDVSQNFFAADFTSLNYFAQVALLKKVGQHSVNERLLSSFEQSLDARDSYRNDLLKEILEHNKNSVYK